MYHYSAVRLEIATARARIVVAEGTALCLQALNFDAGLGGRLSNKLYTVLPDHFTPLVD